MDGILWINMGDNIRLMSPSITLFFRREQGREDRKRLGGSTRT